MKRLVRNSVWGISLSVGAAFILCLFISPILRLFVLLALGFTIFNVITDL